MGTHQPIRKTVTPEIPDKLYFRIGDVSKLCEVPAYVLRFWETEFPALKPNKGGTGQRLYRRKDVEMALRIKSLLYDQGYTIPGARQVLKADVKPAEAPAVPEIAPQKPMRPPAAIADATLSVDQRRKNAAESVRTELKALLALLSDHPTAAPMLTVLPTPARPRMVPPIEVAPLPRPRLQTVSSRRPEGEPSKVLPLFGEREVF